MDDYPNYYRYAAMFQQSDALNALFAVLVAIAIGWLWATRRRKDLMRMNRTALVFGGILMFIICAFLKV